MILLTWQKQFKKFTKNSKMSDDFEDLEEALEDFKLDFFKDRLDKIRSKPWAEKTGSILKKTGMLVGAFGGFCPGIGIIAGALTFTAEVLDPSDLKLSKLKEDVAKMEEKVQQSFNDISEDMQKLDNDLNEVKNVMHETHSLALDQSFKKGMEMVEAAYINFLNGSHNLQGTFLLYQNYMVELQTTAILHLKPEKVKTYVVALYNSQGYEKAKMAFDYAIAVRGKYLQIVCAFYLFKNDQERVEKEFDLFNQDFQELMTIQEDLLQKLNSTPLELENKSSDMKPIENKVQDDNLIKSIESQNPEEGIHEDQARNTSWFSWSKKKTSNVKEISKPSNDGLNDEEMQDKAARTIQNTFKKYYNIQKSSENQIQIDNLSKGIETHVPDAMDEEDQSKRTSWFTWTSKKTSNAKESKKGQTIHKSNESDNKRKQEKPIVTLTLTMKKNLDQSPNSLQIRPKPSRQRSMSDGCIFKGKILNHF